MRSRVTSVAVMFLMVFYCLAIGFVNPYPLYGDNQTHADSSTNYFSTVKAALHDHVSPSVSQVHPAGRYTVPGVNQILSGPWASAIIAEQIFEGKFLQYTHLARKFLVRNRKADLIFPFHYFW